MIIKKLISISLLFICCVILHAQTALPIDIAKQQGIGIAELDSLYMSGVHSDSTLAVFHKNQDEFISSYQKLLQDFGKFLKQNNFNWEKPTKGFNRIYFDKAGKIDYFLYSFRPGQITPEQEKVFGELLNKFIQTYQFPMTADKGYAQCSPVTYMPAAE